MSNKNREILEIKLACHLRNQMTNFGNQVSFEKSNATDFENPKSI